MRKSISIFGATGSIGRNTVDILVRQGGAESYDVKVVTGAQNIALLAEQARILQADMAITADESRLAALREQLSGSGIAVAAGTQALRDAACIPVDWAMSAIVGAAGLAPTINMAKHAQILALANKESLVCAGALLQATCKQHNCRLLPVDSEHSAIFQAMQGRRGDVMRVLLTASGGPFRTWTRAQMEHATLAEALAHPNWDMGQRISIDSATMFNKALEVIEVQELFGIGGQAIEVVVHPQSIIHSMVEFCDGAVIAQLGAPDMRGPIGFALNWPERLPSPVERLDFAALARMDFAAPDEDRFPALRLAREVLEIGGLAGAVFNAAKEAALDRFIASDINFLDMATLVESTLAALHLEAGAASSLDGLDTVLDMDQRARRLGMRWNAN